MCGRYASSRRPEDLVEEFEVVENRVPAPLAPDWNVAPTDPVYAVLERPARSTPEGEEAPRRQLRTLTWGLVPSWAKDPSIGSRMINARAETAAEKPAFRKAFRARRCLVPADGYYEWYASSSLDAKGRPVKQPYFIRPRDGGVLAMAGLFEIWRDPDRPDDDPDCFRWTCTVLTTEAEDDLGHIHDRMPLMVEPERWDAWLDTTLTDADRVTALLTPASPGLLEAYPVSRAVGNVRNNGPELVEPLALEGVPTPRSTR
ncbi:SOS response-associated peptidase [Nocardioides sp. Y6]|uniref:Abasic site processing protein n=1 Tax=Nocardioides malaquae TaxID=2773426 RepID=A0ABR9RPU8_9ACTN|nr:SOS response-associated peptidase [Nocardioides malaquae]MBE7323589.1 SOS response-associated peptidase [Nocardioides malaquae]